MTNATRIDETSLDMKAELLARLKSVVPEAFSDGQLDLDRLAELAGDAVATGPERYGLTWPGKREAIAMLQAPITKAPPLVRNRFHALTQGGIIRPNRLVPYCHPAGADGFTRPPFAHSTVRHQMHDSFPLADKPVQSAQA